MTNRRRDRDKTPMTEDRMKVVSLVATGFAYLSNRQCFIIPPPLPPAASMNTLGTEERYACGKPETP